MSEQSTETRTDAERLADVIALARAAVGEASSRLMSPVDVLAAAGVEAYPDLDDDAAPDTDPPEFRFGDERYGETCCAKPHGCTQVDGERCPFWNHQWKRRNIPDHPNHTPADDAGRP